MVEGNPTQFWTPLGPVQTKPLRALPVLPSLLPRPSALGKGAPSSDTLHSGCRTFNDDLAQRLCPVLK